MSNLSDWFLKFGSGYQVIEDLGIIDKLDSVFGMGEYQELKLLKCKLKNEQEVYVIEETRKGKFILGWEKHYFVISTEGLKRFRDLINSKIN